MIKSKYFITMMIGFVALILSAWSLLISGTEEQKQAKSERFEIIRTGELPWLMVDRETGCQYISNGNDTAYTLLVDASGKPYCKWSEGYK